MADEVVTAYHDPDVKMPSETAVGEARGLDRHDGLRRERRDGGREQVAGRDHRPRDADARSTARAGAASAGTGARRCSRAAPRASRRSSARRSRARSWASSPPTSTTSRTRRSCRRSWRPPSRSGRSSTPPRDAVLPGHLPLRALGRDVLVAVPLGLSRGPRVAPLPRVARRLPERVRRSSPIPVAAPHGARRALVALLAYVGYRSSASP